MRRPLCLKDFMLGLLILLTACGGGPVLAPGADLSGKDLHGRDLSGAPPQLSDVTTWLAGTIENKP